MKIVADRGVCIGAAVCSFLAPDVFDQDPNEGLVVVKVQDLDETNLGAALEAVDQCPSGALALVDVDRADDDS